MVSVLLIDMRTFPPSMGVLEMHTVSHITMTHQYDVPPWLGVLEMRTVSFKGLWQATFNNADVHICCDAMNFYGTPQRFTYDSDKYIGYLNNR